MSRIPLGRVDGMGGLQRVCLRHVWQESEPWSRVSLTVGEEGIDRGAYMKLSMQSMLRAASEWSLVTHGACFQSCYSPFRCWNETRAAYHPASVVIQNRMRPLDLCGARKFMLIAPSGESSASEEWSLGKMKI